MGRSPSWRFSCSYILVSFFNYEASTFSQQQKKILRCRLVRRRGNVVHNRISVIFEAAKMPTALAVPLPPQVGGPTARAPESSMTLRVRLLRRRRRMATGIAL